MALSHGNSREGLSSLSFSSSNKTLSVSSSFQSSYSTSASASTILKMEETIERSEPIITRWDLKNPSSVTSHLSLFDHSRKEARDFIKTVQDLRRAMHFLISNKSGSGGRLVLAQTLMQSAMKRLEKELYHLLSSTRDHLDPKSVSGEDDENSSEEIEQTGEVEIGRVSKLAMADLKSIADCMISAGYGKECINIYKIIRKSIVDEGIYRLGIEKFKLSQLQRMNPDSRDRLIKLWLDSLKVAVQNLLRGERTLCDHVFSSSNTIRESCFCEITKDGAITLFKFPELIAKIKATPRGINQLIELYEALSELWPDVEYIFDFKSTAVVKLQALSSLVRLGNSVQTILSDYEASIQRDSSRTLALGGGIHSLTESAMAFIVSLTAYSGTLSDILADHPHPDGDLQLPESYFGSPNAGDDPTSPISVRIAWFILVLLCKLDTKAELYKDVSLSYLFLANNLHFIVQKVSTSNLRYLLGDEWIARKSKKVRQYTSNYEATAWNKVISCLPTSEMNVNDDSPASPISAEQARSYLRRFNSAFEEAYRRQSSWVVPDGKLRDEIKVSIAKKVVGKYREFCDQNLGLLKRETGTNNLGELVRYGPDDLGNYLSDLLHGTAISGSSSISSSSSSSSRGCLPLPR